MTVIYIFSSLLYFPGMATIFLGAISRSQDEIMIFPRLLDHQYSSQTLKTFIAVKQKKKEE